MEIREIIARRQVVVDRDKNRDSNNAHGEYAAGVLYF